VNETLEKDLPKEAVFEKTQSETKKLPKPQNSFSKGKIISEKSPTPNQLGAGLPVEGKYVHDKSKEKSLDKKQLTNGENPSELDSEQAQDAKSFPLTLFSTYYYVISEEDYSGEARTAAVKSMDGEVLALVSPRFKKALTMEGTGVLLDSRILNYVGSKMGTSRFTVIKEPFGRGSTGCSLIPFKSIAVDPKVIPLGSIIQIKETIGMILPDGSKHNGLWFADDIGQIISGSRIDLFIGREKNVSTLKKQGIAENNNRMHYNFMKSDMSRSRCKEKK
jgi:3D (Asp-Asp-Asp) domain-containing protein